MLSDGWKAAIRLIRLALGFYLRSHDEDFSPAYIEPLRRMLQLRVRRLPAHRSVGANQHVHCLL
jgi:hypothetical protein